MAQVYHWAARLPKNKTAWHAVARASPARPSGKAIREIEAGFCRWCEERADEARRPNSSVPLLDWRVEYDGLVPRLLLRLRVSKLLGGAAERSRIGSGKGPNRKTVRGEIEAILRLPDRTGNQFGGLNDGDECPDLFICDRVVVRICHNRLRRRASAVDRGTLPLKHSISSMLLSRTPVTISALL